MSVGIIILIIIVALLFSRGGRGGGFFRMRNHHRGTMHGRGHMGGTRNHGSHGRGRR